jgi:hypothetical protein
LKNYFPIHPEVNLPDFGVQLFALASQQSGLPMSKPESVVNSYHTDFFAGSVAN